MKKSTRLANLKALAEMVRDQKLAKLQVCAAARAATLNRLADLRPAEADPAESIAAVQARLRYEHWADLRRAEMNVVLARQTVQWMEAREDARTTFGRAEVLRQLQAKWERLQ